MTLKAAEEELSKQEIITVLREVFARGEDVHIAYAEVVEGRRVFGREAFKKVELLVWRPSLAAAKVDAKKVSTDTATINPTSSDQVEELRKKDQAKLVDQEREIGVFARKEDNRKAYVFACKESEDLIEDNFEEDSEDVKNLVKDEEEAFHVFACKESYKVDEEARIEVGPTVTDHDKGESQEKSKASVFACKENIKDQNKAVEEEAQKALESCQDYYQKLEDRSTVGVSENDFVYVAEPISSGQIEELKEGQVEKVGSKENKEDDLENRMEDLVKDLAADIEEMEAVLRRSTEDEVGSPSRLVIEKSEAIAKVNVDLDKEEDEKIYRKIKELRKEDTSKLSYWQRVVREGEILEEEERLLDDLSWNKRDTRSLWDCWHEALVRKATEEKDEDSRVSSESEQQIEEVFDLMKLPNELIREIMLRMTPEDLTQLSRVGSLFRSLTETQIFWKTKLMEEFVVEMEDCKDWREEYKARYVEKLKLDGVLREIKEKEEWENRCAILKSRHHPKLFSDCVAKWNEDGVWYQASPACYAENDGYVVKFSVYGNLDLVGPDDIKLDGRFIPPNVPHDQIDWMVRCYEGERGVANLDMARELEIEVDKFRPKPWPREIPLQPSRSSRRAKRKAAKRALKAKELREHATLQSIVEKEEPYAIPKSVFAVLAANVSGQMSRTYGKVDLQVEPSTCGTVRETRVDVQEKVEISTAAGLKAHESGEKKEAKPGKENLVKRVTSHSKTPRKQEARRLCVALAPDTLTNQQVEDHFKKYGTISDFYCVREKKVIYVEFLHAEDAQKGVKERFQKIEGVTVRVVWSYPKANTRSEWVYPESTHKENRKAIQVGAAGHAAGRDCLQREPGGDGSGGVKRFSKKFSKVGVYRHN